MSALYSRAKEVRLAIFDVDGVLTDGTLYYTDSGEELKAFNVRDGHGMKMLQSTGVTLAIITSRSSRSIERRAQNLGIDLLYQGAEDKLAAFHALLKRTGQQAASCSYMGDDLVDLPVLTRAGLAATVPEAPAAVRQGAHHVTQAGGGRGAVRELCELIMHAQGTFEGQLAAWMR